jgi:hypothetical protein
VVKKVLTDYELFLSSEKKRIVINKWLTSNSPNAETDGFTYVCRMRNVSAMPTMLIPGINVVGTVFFTTIAVSLKRPSITCTEFFPLLIIEESDLIFSSVKFTATRISGRSRKCGARDGHWKLMTSNLALAASHTGGGICFGAMLHGIPGLSKTSC